MGNTWESIWSVVDRIGIVIGLTITVPIFWSWYLLVTTKRRQKTFIKSLEKLSGNRPAAVLIDIGVGDSENQVIAYLKEKNLDVVPLKINIEKLQKDELQSFVEKLHAIKAGAMSKGADRLHLFYKGPVVGALIVGEVFSNTAVTIYHFEKTTGSYESWGSLHRSYL